MDTLAVRLTLPPVGRVEDFHLPAGAPCRAHNKKAATYSTWQLLVCSRMNSAISSTSCSL
jgi:hypothetical protein